MRIDWKDIYKTGNAQIDAQHLQWFNKVNYFLEAPDKESRAVAATKMYHYTRLHFQDEDQIMKLTNYPGAREHTRRHNDTLVHMNLLLEQIANDALDLEKWRAFLSDLFLNHIGDADLKLAAYLTAEKRAARRNGVPVDAQWWTKGELQSDSGRVTKPGLL